MTEPFDVSLRVKLAYDAANGAKAAISDIEGVRSAAQRLGAQQGIAQSTRDLDGLVRRAASAKISLEDLARAGARLAGTATGAGRLATDVAAVIRPAADARRELGAVASAAVGLGRSVGAISGDGLHTLSREATDARRAIADASTAAGRLASISAPAALTTGLGAAATAAASLERQIDGLVAAGEKLKPWTPAQSAAAMKEFENQIKTGRAEIGALEKAAERVGAAAGPVKLAESVAAVTPAATEARRHIDDVATAARSAERDLSRMGRAAGGSGGGGNGSGEGEIGRGAGGGGHGAGGGLRNAAMAAARPLRMERLVMSAMTPIGLAGLGAGLGVSAIGRELKGMTDQAIDFEAAMVDVRRSVGDMPDEGVKRLETTILGVSSATGTSKDEIAGMAAAAARAGRPLADLPRFLELGAKSANVMGLKVEEAGSKLVQLGRAWGQDQAGLEDTSDAIALAAEKTGARAGGVLDFTNRFSNMRQRGMSARQVAGFGAGFQASGLDPSQAESAFGSLSDKLANPQNAGKPFEFDLGRLDIGPTQARLGMRSDPTRTMMSVLDKLKALPDMQRVPMLERMFGPEGGREIGKIVEHLDDLKRTLGLVENTAQRSGALERSFKIFDDTTRAKLDKMAASADRLATAFGKLFAPAVGNSADATARALDAVTKFLDLSDKANVITGKQVRGEALSPDDQADLAKHPTLRAYVGQDPDPAATAAKRESDRQKALKTIQDLDRSARDSQDPQIRGMADDAQRDYRSTYPDRPKGEESSAPSVSDKHASTFDRSMIQPASYSAGDDDGRPGRGSASDALRVLLAAATKQGVVEGLREFMDGRGGGMGGGVGIVNASYDGEGFGGGAGASVGLGSAGGGEASGTGRRSIRYGGGFRAGRGTAQHHSLRYGGGYGPKGVGGGGPAYGSAVPGANGRGTINAPYTAPIDAKGEGGILSPRELFGYLKSKGATDNEATMLTGAAGSESSFNPNAVHDVNGKNGPGHGLWGHNDHRLDMRGKSWQQQADLALGEVKREYADRVNGAKTPEELTDAEMHYERPRAYSPRNPRGGENYTGRANTLRRFGNEFGTMKSSSDPRSIAGEGNRRGFANLMHGQYGAPGENLTSIKTPSGRSVQVHAAAADSFRGFLGDLEKSGYNIDSLGGYANRGMRGNSGRISQHAFGNAIDINPGRNPFHTSQTDLPKNVSDMAAKWGLSWGGDWSERSRDPMHFEWTGARPWENKQGPVAGPANKPNVMPFGLTGSALASMDRTRAARLAAASEDRGSRSTMVERAAALAERTRGGDHLSPRFGDPRMKLRHPDAGTTSASAGGGQQFAGGPAPIQNFYGMHDPAETARRSMMESNREVRRSQARALHSVGRIA